MCVCVCVCVWVCVCVCVCVCVRKGMKRRLNLKKKYLELMQCELSVTYFNMFFTNL